MAGRPLRSTVRVDRLKHQQIHPALIAVGEIPGERIIYDGEKGEVVIEDRLGYGENRPIRQQLDDQARHNTTVFDPAVSGHPRPTETYRLHTDDDRATWLASLRQMHDAGYLLVREGTIPAQSEIDTIGTWIKTTNAVGFQTRSIHRHQKTEPQKPAKAGA